ncbi:MAG: flavin reductase family protein [Burkholderiaceae bacterium]
MHATDYRNLMRNHAGATVVIATGSPGSRTGLTATAFCSLSDAPPLILVCVNKSASAHPLILETRCFSVNLLDRGQQDIALRFAGRTGLKGEERFDADWTCGATGVPVLRRALANLECELASAHDHGSHSVFVGEVRALAANEHATPLIYFRGDFGGLGQARPALA